MVKHTWCTPSLVALMQLVNKKHKVVNKMLSRFNLFKMMLITLGSFLLCMINVQARMETVVCSFAPHGHGQKVKIQSDCSQDLSSFLNGFYFVKDRIASVHSMNSQTMPDPTPQWIKTPNSGFLQYTLNTRCASNDSSCIADSQNTPKTTFFTKLLANITSIGLQPTITVVTCRANQSIEYRATRHRNPQDRVDGESEECTTVLNQYLHSVTYTLNPESNGVIVNSQQFTTPQGTFVAYTLKYYTYATAFIADWMPRALDH